MFLVGHAYNIQISCEGGRLKNRFTNKLGRGKTKIIYICKIFFIIMDGTPLETRVEPSKNSKMGWPAVIPPLAVVVAVAATLYGDTPPEARAERAFTAKYGDVHAGRKDVNGDGEFEYVISYRNPSTREQEQRILQFRDGQPVLSRFEVQDGKIIFLD